MNWISGDLPGIGGSYKLCPEDFQVEEIPLYPCSGKGEHLFLQIEKRGLTTNEMLRQIAACLRLASRDVGYAGLKDAQAVTRQWISLPARSERQLSRLEQLPLTILTSTRHDNKLRLGHLAGNRFQIRLSKPKSGARQKADRILQLLQKQGVPNRFGEQRYGVLGNSHRLGQFLLSGKYLEFCRELLGDPLLIQNSQWREAALLFRAGDFRAAAQSLPLKMGDEKRLAQRLAQGDSPRNAAFSLPKRMLRLYLSALQAWFFDQLLLQRLPQLGQLQDGDLAIKHVNGACFLVEDAAQEQQRADQFEISPTAPLFGSKTKLAAKNPGQQERDLLKQFGLCAESWKIGNGLTMPGERRALRVPLSAVATREIGNDLQLNFCLPRGSYATSVLTELIKQTPPEIAPLQTFE